MEDWLSQLEMDWNNNEDMLFSNDVYMQYDHNHEQIGSMESLNEELAIILGEDFPSPISLESNISSPLAYNIPKVPSNLSISNEPISPIVCDIARNTTTTNNNNNNNNNNDNNSMHLAHEDPNNVQLLDGSSGKDEGKQQDGNKGKRKRKREPSQIYDHIMAERKRRELLAQLFIALSAILPGLKKVDKTSILGEAIKHLQQLKEKVKSLEEAVAKQKVNSMVIVKRSRLVVDNDKDEDEDEDDNDKDDSSCTVEDNCTNRGQGRRDGGGSDYPHIEVKVSNKTLLLTLCCENRKGISAKIFGEVEKHDNIILNSCIAPFGVSAFNITIVAQTEKTDKKHVKNLVKSLHSILRSP